MASISQETNGRWKIQFSYPVGKRHTVRLGNLTGRMAETYKRQIEQLLNAAWSGEPVKPETARWIADLNDRIRDRLARAGLVRQVSSAILADFIDSYVAGRTDLKPRTIIKFRATRDYLIEFFGAERQLREISLGGADDWRVFLVGKGLAENTIRKHSQIAKQLFTAAVRHKLIEDNPFTELKSTVLPNPNRFYFVTEDIAQQVLDQCPDAEWRLIFALARYGGLRCPGEVLSLTWDDVDWDRERIRIPSPKTEHHVGKAFREIPIFWELKPYLQEAFELAPEGATHVISRYRGTNTNLRTHLNRIIRRAGLQPWPKLFQNLRSTRQTELVQQGWEDHVVCAFIGNTRSVANRHYLQVTESHFERATQGPSSGVVQKATQSVHAKGVCGGQQRHASSQMSGFSTPDSSGQCLTRPQVAEEGLEPPTRGL
jgi:integrase